MTLSAILVQCVLRAQELCLPINFPSLGHFVQASFAVLTECLQAEHKQVKRGGKLFIGPSWDMQDAGLNTRMLSTPDKRIQGGSIGLCFSLELADHHSC